MFNFLRSLLNSVFSIIFTMLLLKKENEISRRHLNLQNKRLYFRKSDKVTFSMIKALSTRAMNHLTIVKPKLYLVGNADSSRISRVISINLLEENLSPEISRI